MTKTEKMRRIELERGQSMEALISAAGEQGMTWEELADDLGISRLTLRAWIGRLGGKPGVRRVIQYARDDAGSR